jgi:hypothetical protein
MISTTTDPLSKDWAIDDEVIALRRWATDLVYPLPPTDGGRLMIGTAPTCAIQVDDPSHLTSRKHAYLERVARRWGIVDQSKNGLYLDDQPRQSFLLAPGIEIGLGRYVILVAESARTIALRRALSRMLGWSAARAESIDLALRMLRLAATGRALLVLCGESYLVPFAEELHRLTHTEQRPFVLCNPRRRASEDTESFTRCVTSGLAAVEQAADGTICIDDQRRPPDLVEMLYQLRQPECPAQLIVLTRNAHKAELYSVAPVVIPPLRTRREEIDRLIMEYEAEAVQRLGVDPLTLTPAQRAWIREQSSETLIEIRTATLRLVALHHAGSVAAAAALLKMSHVGLGQWLERRSFEPGLVPAP